MDCEWLWVNVGSSVLANEPLLWEMLNRGGYTSVEGRKYMVNLFTFLFYCEPRTGLKKFVTHLIGNTYYMPGSYHPYLQTKKPGSRIHQPLIQYCHTLLEFFPFQIDSLCEAHLKSENQGLIFTD